MRSWFEKKRRPKQSNRRRLRLEIIEPRMMLHGDAMDGHDAMTDMDDASMAAEMAETTHSHTESDGTTTEHTHAAGIEVPEGVTAPTISITATNDYLGGVDVSVTIADFKIVQTDATDPIDGEGHLHLYLDGVKVTRFYDLAYKMQDVESGLHTITVGLNAHDHSAYLLEGSPIEASTTIVVAESLGESQAELIEAEWIQGELIQGTSDFVITGGDAGDASGRSVSSAGDFNGDGVEDLLIGAPAADGSAGAAYIVYGSATGLTGTIDLSALSASAGLAIGGSSGELAGSSVSSAGDINHDGFDDVIIGAPNADQNGVEDTGAAYVVFGGSNLAASITLSALDGTNGFRLNGAAAGDAAGGSVAGIGDFNSDGFDDFAVGAAGADADGHTDAGAVYVVFGAASFTASSELSGLTGSNGFRLDGAAAGDELGFTVASAGDMNGDGFDDLIVGAPGATVNGEADAGAAYVVLGSANSAATLDVATLSGSNGFRLDGVDGDDRAGFAVAGGGDANGDGFDDVIIGSPRAEVDGVSVGAAYVVFGKSDGFAANVSLDSLDGSNGFRLAGDYESDPLLSSFIVNTTGRTAYDVPNQNTHLVEDALVNFVSVVPDATSVYVTSSGISYQVIGPFPGNPGTVTDQDRTHVIPRSPTVETGDKVATRLGSTGVWIDGVAVYNWSDAMSYENAGVWNQNAVYFEGDGLDANGGHPPPSGEYHTHTVNIGLMTDLGDDGSDHSPILGWSYDGYPIYGPWGFANDDGTGDIVKLDSSWQTRDITERTHLADGTDVADGPTIAETPLGAYVEDYEYVEGLGDLDEYNGRFSVTPEYPEGIYHYVVTIDGTETISVGSGVFPYVIGLEYYGVVEEANLTAGGDGPPAGDGPPGGGPPPVGGPPVGGGGDAPALVEVEIGTAEISVGLIDVNGDGIADSVVGDPDAYNSDSNVSGSVDIVYGSTGVMPADTHLHDVTGADGVSLLGTTDGDGFGTSLGGVDINGDGGGDVAIGVPGANSGGGETFVGLGVANNTIDAGITVTVSGGGSAIISDDGTSVTLNVTLDTQPTSDVVLAVLSSNVNEGTVSPSSLTFTTENWNVIQSVTVTGVADGVVDGDRSFFIVFDPKSVDFGYAALVNTSIPFASIDVDVVSTNEAPTADAGGPYSGLTNDTLTLSGSGSSDTDGTIVSYAWDLDHDGHYDDASGVTATYGTTASGTFTVGLQVTDDDGATSIDTATITVTNEDSEAALLPSQIYTPDYVVGPHVIPGDSIPTAIIFQAVSDAVITVTPVDPTSVTATIWIYDGDGVQVSQFSGGVATATLTAGGTYAIVFQPQTEDRTYTVQSSADSDAFAMTATTNILQRTDTNGDSYTSALDALEVINQLNRLSAFQDESSSTPYLLDVNGDDRVTAFDALLVINEVNRRGRSGQAFSAAGEMVATPLLVPLASVADGEDNTSDESLPASPLHSPPSPKFEPEPIYDPQRVDAVMLDDWSESDDDDDDNNDDEAIDAIARELGLTWATDSTPAWS